MTLQPNIPDSPHPRVLIIGAGFAGINLVKALRGKPFQVVLIDRNNYHLFMPLLYQVATAGLEPSSIAFPVRGIFREKGNFIFRMAEVEKINPGDNSVDTAIGTISYDYLVMGTGSISNYFGNKNFEQYGKGMKSLYEAVGIRNYGLRVFERVLLMDDEEQKKKALNIVIVGAGPTGVELAGAMAEFKKSILPKDYPELAPGLMNIYLIEASSRVLATMSEAASAHTKDFLTKMGVKILLDTKVNDYDGETVTLGNGDTIPTRSFIWSAGVMGNALPGLDPATVLRNGRIEVDAFNQVKGSPNIFAIGDIAQMGNDPRFPRGYPMLAQVAIQQGKNLAGNLVRLIHKQALIPFKYKDKGSMATIGRNKAVADIGRSHLHGFFAWMAWMGVHLLFLMGFRNKLIVFMNWVYSYFTYDRGTRIILKRHADGE